MTVGVHACVSKHVKGDDANGLHDSTNCAVVFSFDILFAMIVKVVFAKQLDGFFSVMLAFLMQEEAIMTNSANVTTCDLTPNAGTISTKTRMSQWVVCFGGGPRLI